MKIRLKTIPTIFILMWEEYMHDDAYAIDYPYNSFKDWTNDKHHVKITNDKHGLWEDESLDFESEEEYHQFLLTWS